MKPEAKQDAVVERMVFLARQLGTQAPDSRREQQFVATLSDRVQAHRALHLRRRQLAGFSAIAATCFFCLLWFKFSEHRLSYRISDRALTQGEIIGQAGTSIAFSDGSKLALTHGARARIAEVTAHGARVNLVEGEVAVDIVKAEGNAWFVQAGPYQVHVVGTAFDVRWTNERGLLEVDLHRGSVVVTGPQIKGQLRLQPGQRLTSSATGSSTVARAEATRASSAASAAPASESATAEQGPATQTEASADPTVATAERRDSAGVGPTSWSHWVAQGEFGRVLEAAQKRGIDHVLASGTQAELAALADAARYGRNTLLARQALLAERKRFPRAAVARGAAFFLGGTEADGSAAALTWYETYLNESPRGPYAPQALGRRMMLVHRRSGSAASASLAREYLQRFAQGPYASAAHKILERPSE